MNTVDDVVHWQYSDSTVELVVAGSVLVISDNGSGSRYVSVSGKVSGSDDTGVSDLSDRGDRLVGGGDLASTVVQIYKCTDSAI